MVKSLRLELLLAVVFVATVSSVHSAPRSTGKASKIVKKPTPVASAAVVAAQFERIAKAYSSLGAFTVTVLETEGVGKESGRTRYTAAFGGDGRLGLKMARLDGRGAVTGNSVAQLYDSHEIITATNGEPAQHSEVKHTNPETDPTLITEFFSNTFGGQLVGVLSKYKRGPEGYTIYGSYRVQTLPGGKTRIENVTVSDAGKDAVTGTTVFLVGATGFVESIEANGVQNGHPVFHAQSTLSRPAALSADSLIWEKFGPPPNPNFSIDAPSRVVFERAAKLYGEAKTFTTKISGTVQHPADVEKEPTWTADVAWERRGRLRLQSSRNSTVLAYDGTNMHVIADGTLRQIRTFATTPNQLTLTLLQTLVPDHDPFVRFPMLLVNLLQGQTTDFTQALHGATSRQVSLETGATLYNMPCDVVNVMAKFASKTEPATLEDRYWFAQADGRLLRVTSKLTLKDAVDSTDVRLNDQKIDAVLPDSTWQLTVPAKKP